METTRTEIDSARLATRAAAEWSVLAGEPVTVESIGGTLYAYGSEIVCLRLAYKFRRCGERARCDYSKNLATWFFRLEPSTATL